MVTFYSEWTQSVAARVAVLAATECPRRCGGEERARRIAWRGAKCNHLKNSRALNNSFIIGTRLLTAGLSETTCSFGEIL